MADAEYKKRRAAVALVKEQQQTFFEALYAGRDADAQEIVDGINLGAHAAAKDKKAMQRRKISHVLICHPALPELHPGVFKTARAPILDDPESNILEQIPKALAFLGEARLSGGKVFICCAKGISRSSTMVIALLMLERMISFDEAFKICEQRRPIVYPNIGFQQQLRILERFMQDLDPKASFQDRVRALREVVPRGSLSGPSSPLKIRDMIGETTGQVLEELVALADKVLSQPQLLQNRELWKRHGLFFENLHKYKALPSSAELLDHARSAAKTLKSLTSIFSDTLKGVQLGLAVAKELDGWVAFAAPIFSNPLFNPRKQIEQMQEKISADVAGEEAEEDPMKDYCDAAAAKKSKKDKKAEKKKEKEDNKQKEKADKADKKAAKAQKKAEKAVARIEKAASKAEQIADMSRKQAVLAGERADQLSKEIEILESREVEDSFEAVHLGANRRGGNESAAARRAREREPSPSGSSGSRSSSRPKKRRR